MRSMRGWTKRVMVVFAFIIASSGCGSGEANLAAEPAEPVEAQADASAGDAANRIVLMSERPEHSAWYEGCEAETYRQIFDPQENVKARYQYTCDGWIACEDILAHPVPTWVHGPPMECVFLSFLPDRNYPFHLAQMDYFDKECRVYLYGARGEVSHWGVSNTDHWISVADQPVPSPPFEELSEAERILREPEVNAEWVNATPCDGAERDGP